MLLEFMVIPVWGLSNSSDYIIVEMVGWD